MWEQCPSAAHRAERSGAPLSQSACWHRRRRRRLLALFASATVPASPAASHLGLNDGRRKRNKAVPNDGRLTRCEKEKKREKGDQNRSDMGAFRVLLGSLHYLGLYVQLSLCSRQAGHGDVENRISGNGTCFCLCLCFMGRWHR